MNMAQIEICLAIIMILVILLWDGSLKAR